MRVIASILLACAAAVSAAASGIASVQAPDASRRHSLDTILDTYVRDGFVYYRALKAERARLDGYLAQLGSMDVDKLSREGQIAFWLNAYNAVVLKTVVDHYPIQGHAPQYPQHSIRQIPGSFDRLQHHIAGRTL